MGDPYEALRACKNAYTIYLNLNHQDRVASTQANMAYFLRILDRFCEAEDLLLEAGNYFQTVHHNVSIARTEMNLGLLAYGQGDYQKALKYFVSANVKFSELTLPIESANVNIQQAFLYKDLNLLTETINLTEQIGQVFKQNEMIREYSQSLFIRGMAYQRLGRYEQATVVLAKARRMLHRQGAWGKLWALDVDRAELAWQMGQVKTAWRIGRRVENKIEADIYPSLAARLHLLLARCRLSQKQRLNEANERIEQALSLCQQYHLAEIGVKASALMGQWWEQNGRFAQAHHHLQQAIHKSERLLSYLSMDEFQVGFMEGKLSVYTEFVRLTHQLVASGQLTTADLLHSLNLMQTAPLPHNTAASPTQTDSDNNEDLTELRQRWQWFQHKLGGGWQESKAATSEMQIRKELHQIEMEMAELMRRQRVQQTAVVTDDILTETQSVKAQTPDQLLSAIQQQLRATEGLLQLYIINDRFHILFITAAETHLVANLAESRAVQKVMRAWHFYLRQAQSGRTPSAIPYLMRLYKMFIAPLAEQLAVCEHLYLVLPPDWHNIPVAALYDGQKYLVETYRFTYLSAASVLLTHQQQVKLPAQPKALVVGYDNNGRLPYALQEAKTVTEALTPTWKVEQALAETATTETFREASQTSHLIHLATHAVFRLDNPYFSWIQLAGSSLTVADMYHITLPERPLVVLSACETGRGLARGGGLLGMGRGFLAAGASGLVVTLWRVSDEATAQFVETFYTHLSQQSDVTTLLQMAQKTAVALGLSPFYWAGFIFVGG